MDKEQILLNRLILSDSRFEDDDDRMKTIPQLLDLHKDWKQKVARGEK